MKKANSNCGVDLHKYSLTIAALNAQGREIACETIPTKCIGRIQEFFKELPRPIFCAIESVGMYRWLWKLLKPLCDRLMLADATELACRRGKRRQKTDIKDAQHLAKLVFIADVPEVYVPEGPVFDLRRLGRQWHRSSQVMATLKIRMRWFLNHANLRGPEHLDGPSARRWLLAFGRKLDPIASECVARLLDSIEHLELQRLQMERQLDCMLEKHFAALSDLLQSVPGIATINAAVLIGEVGDFRRFHSAEAFACYTGLTERLRESAGKKAKTKISKAGSPTLRWALVEAATTLCRSDPYYRSRYEKLVKKTGIKKKARVAMARKLACILWKMAGTGALFQRTGSTNHTKPANKVRLARKRNKISDAV